MPPPSAPVGHRCGLADREYTAWFRRTFGGGVEVLQDGPDATRIKDLTGAPKAEAESMLRRGLASCDPFAVAAIEGAGWRQLIPELLRAVAAGGGDFRVRVILALKALGDRDDLTNDFIAVLSSGSSTARITAAIGARQFSLDRVRGPLLDRVRQDRSYFVRFHAAESLIALADIYPRALNEHPAIFAAVVGDRSKNQSLLSLLDLPPPLSADERARLATAADQLDAEISERLAMGRCSKPARRTMINLQLVPIAGGKAAALIVEESVGSCARTLGFVAFIASPGGFSRRLSTGSTGRDPLQVTIETLPTPVNISYTRAAGVLNVGDVTLDTAKANVAVLSVGPAGVTARYRGKRELTFTRDPTPATASEFDDLLLSRTELGAAVTSVLKGTPELRGLVGASP